MDKTPKILSLAGQKEKRRLRENLRIEDIDIRVTDLAEELQRVNELLVRTLRLLKAQGKDK